MKEPVGVDNLIRGNTLYKAFEYWAQNWTPPKDTNPRDKMRLEQEYMEYLIDNMGRN